jgi:sec-independent protein translocase protein TatA
MGIGPREIVVILLVVMLLFGSSRIAELGKGLGEGIKNFKKSISDGGEKAARSDADTEKAK